MTIAEIVAKAGIPRTSLYRHVPPRTALALTAGGKRRASHGQSSRA